MQRQLRLEWQYMRINLWRWEAVWPGMRWWKYYWWRRLLIRLLSGETSCLQIWQYYHSKQVQVLRINNVRAQAGTKGSRSKPNPLNLWTQTLFEAVPQDEPERHQYNDFCKHYLRQDWDLGALPKVLSQLFLNDRQCHCRPQHQLWPLADSKSKQTHKFRCYFGRWAFHLWSRCRQIQTYDIEGILLHRPFNIGHRIYSCTFVKNDSSIDPTNLTICLHLSSVFLEI